MKDPNIQALMIKAQRAIKSAERQLQEGDPDFSASRVYYAMFYIAQALLMSKDLRFHRHSGVLSAFGRELVKVENFPQKFQTYLNTAFDLRNESDYEIMSFVVDEDVKEKNLSS